MKTFMQQVAHLVQVGVFLVLNCLLLKFSLTSPDSFLTNASWKKHVEILKTELATKSYQNRLGYSVELEHLVADN